MQKEITVVLYGYNLTNHEWSPDLNLEDLDAFVATLHQDFNSLGITVSYLNDSEKVLEVNGYGDLLNIVRLRAIDGPHKYGWCIDGTP